MKKITRQEAADYLGTSIQTISNWVSRGVINAVKAGKQIYIDEEELKKIAPQYKIIIAKEEGVAMKEKELDAKIIELETSIREVKEQCLHLNALNKRYICGSICELFKGFVPMNERDTNIICRYLRSESVQSIADCYGLSTNRVLQIIGKGLYDFSQKVTDINIIAKEVEYLRKENKVLEAAVAVQRGKEIDNAPFLKFSERIIDQKSLSLKTIKRLRFSDIETIGQLVQHGRKDIMDIPKIGAKSMSEIEDMLKDMNLTWGMKDAKAYEKGKLTEDAKTPNMPEFISKISSYITERESARKEEVIKEDKIKQLILNAQLVIGG